MSFKTYDEENDKRIRISCRKAVKKAFESYVQAMDDLVNGDQALTSDSLKAEHERMKDEAVESFLEKNQYGSNNENSIDEDKDHLIEVGCFERRFRSLKGVLYL